MSRTRFLNGKELLARNRCNIWSLSDINGIRTHKNLVCKWTLSVHLWTKSLRIRIPLLSLKRNYAFVISVDFQKTFDTVDQHIVLKVLEHYGVRGIPKKWFSSYLSSRKQFVSLNGCNSNLPGIECRVSQFSKLEPLVSYLHKWFTSSNQIFQSTPLWRWY